MAAFLPPWLVFFFFNDTATTEIYTLSLHDALPILITRPFGVVNVPGACACEVGWAVESPARRCGAAAAVAAAICRDRKSTRLNSSHLVISYAVFCLKKKTEQDAIG